MRNSKAVLEYWQHALRIQAVANFVPDKAKDSWRQISAEECKQGKIDNNIITASMLAQGSWIVIAPCFAQKLNKFFVPYLLLAELDANGNFVSKAENAWPIIPLSNLEPAEFMDISLGSDQNFENYFILQPPDWVETNSVTWAQQLNYAEQMLENVTEGGWRQQLQQLQYSVSDNALIFSLAALHKEIVLDDKILKNKVKCQLIQAERNSGKSEYAKKIILDAWIEAAVKQAPPPAYVWLRYKQLPRYSNILDYIDRDAKVSAFISAQDGSTDTHKELAQCFTAYIRGKQVLRNWADLQEKLANKYADKGGIAARISQLKTMQKDAHVRQRHMQVLNSIWVRQLELIPGWSKIFDFIPSLQRRRLQRLHLFFKQNFPNENVQEYSQEQLQGAINEKVRRSENTYRFIADALHQTETDLHQQELVRDKCLNWVANYGLSFETIEQVEHFIYQEVWTKLVALTVQYWQAFFNLNKEYMNFAIQEPNNIEMLIVEHSEYVSPMQAAQLIAVSKNAIIMGNYNNITIPRFSPQIDYVLAKHFELAQCDADFEDLQFDGISAAMGNMWNLTTQGKESDKTLTADQDKEKAYEFIDIHGQCADYYGSKINVAEVDAILSWLIKSQHASSDIAIYTTFSGQASYLRNQLKGTKFAAVKVCMVQEPCFEKTKINLFSAVYTAVEPGPYCFDRGAEILENLIANTETQLIVFADKKIFNPALHSAAGNFAKLFSISIELEEVACV